MQDVLACKGTVICTGVGKSGFIAQKICMTLVSTGTKSIFLNPSDALHGDIGVLGPLDILVFFSKSGSTEELISLIPYVKAKGAKLVAVTSSKTSILSDLCSDHIYLPLEQELCPFNLAPVTSTAIQMIFGDTCAVAIMKAKSISMDAYAMNHPAGRIGKRLVLRVCDITNSIENIASCKTSEKLQDILFDMSAKGFGCTLVVDEENLTLAGVFTDGDLRRKLNLLGKAALKMKMSDLVRSTLKSKTFLSLHTDKSLFLSSPPR